MKNVKRKVVMTTVPETLLIKLGSALIHYHEHESAHGVPLDLLVARQLMQDPEVTKWIKSMGVLLPLPRTKP